MKKRVLSIVLLLSLALQFLPIAAFAAPSPVNPPFTGLDEIPEPIDPQTWKFQNEMTWDEYKPNPVVDWDNFDMSKTATRKINGLIILVDFPDRSFIVTEEPGSELVGNPQIGPIATEDLADFWKDYLNTPSALNSGATISGYWAESSYGQWDISISAAGPFTLPGFEMQYGFSYGVTTNAANPLGDTAPGITRYSSSQYTSQSLALAVAGGVDMSLYDFCFILHAGYDESGTWQEFGEMMFETKEDVPAEFGALARVNKILALGYELPEETINWAKARDAAGKNWSKSRYGPDPWSSWYGSMGRWSFASSTTVNGRSIRISVQGESDGMGVFAHEFGHISGLTDNYNDPFAVPSQRSYSAPWDTMGTGKIGPGGNHNRWQTPSTMGSSSPIHSMLRTKLSSSLNFLQSEDIVDINIDALRAGTPVVAEIVSRNVPNGELFGVTQPNGLRVNSMVEQKPRITRDVDWMSDTFNGANWWDGYCIEVVDRSGYDSFASDNGVLISKFKTAERAPHTWVIDAHPEEMKVVDYISPAGNEVMMSQGDMLQLADAAFHAGVSEIDHPYGFSGDVVNEYVDEWNGLHFYILDKHVNPGAYGDVLSYTVAVRASDATLGETPPKAGLPVDGVLEVTANELAPAIPGKVAIQEFKIKNTGTATDIVRVTLGGNLDWNPTILNNLFAIKAGEEITVPVYIEVPADLGVVAPMNLTFTASSETNATKTTTVDIENIADNASILTIDLQLSKLLLNEGDYFNVETSLTKTLESNVVVLDYAYDQSKIDFANYSLPAGVEFIKWERTPTGVQLVLMVQDYAMNGLVDVMFQAKETLTGTEDLFTVVGHFAVKYTDGKEVLVLSNSLDYDPSDNPVLIKFDLIYLSNVIDAFGKTNKSEGWNELYKRYDFDKNNRIDIQDISFAARNIDL